MAFQHQKTSIQKANSLADDNSSLKAKFFLASFPSSSSSIPFEKVLLIIDYLQILHPIFIFTIFSLDNHNSFFSQAVLLFVRLFNPAHWIPFEQIHAFQIIVFIILAALTFAKLLLLGYIVFLCLHYPHVQNCWTKIWAFLMKTQIRMSYYFVTSFFMNLIAPINWTTFQFIVIQHKPLAILSIVLILLEFGLTLIPMLIGHCIFPTKSFLSSKNNFHELMALVQKLVLQILLAALSVNSKGNSWIFVSTNLVIDVVRNMRFFMVLPLYKFEALKCQGSLLMLVTALNLSYLAILIKGNTSLKDVETFIGIWVILAILGIKITRNYLEKVFVRLVSDPMIRSANLLLHRVAAIKELKRRTLEYYEGNNKCEFRYLAKRTLSSQIKRILGVEGNIEGPIKEILKKYLDKLMERYPENELIKVFTAEFYFKSLKVCGVPTKICTALKNDSTDKSIRMNAELLLIKIQNSILTRYHKKFQEYGVINLGTVAFETSFISKLRYLMLEQASLEIDCYSEIVKENPDLQKILSGSQKSNKIRQQITTELTLLPTKISEFHLEPLLLCAKYHSSITHSILDYTHYLKLYAQKLRKYHKFHDQERLCQENAFQDVVGSFFLSGNKADAGTIIYASKANEKLYGGNVDQYPGINVAEKASPIFRQVYASFYKTLSENPNDTLFGKALTGYIYNLAGYILEVDFFMDIHPFTTQGFYFFLLIRATNAPKELLLLHENGDIDSATKDIIAKLNLCPGTPGVIQTNVKTISEELARMNMAFNIMAYPEKYAEKNLYTMTKEEAEEIYSLYTTYGNDVLLFNPATGESFSYKCTAKSQVYGPLIIKVVSLEENFVAKESKKGPSIKFGDSGIFNTEEEKEEGWIDFGPLTPPEKKIQYTAVSPRSLQTDRDQLLLKTQEENLTQQNFFFPQTSKSNAPLESPKESVLPSTASKNQKKNSPAPKAVPNLHNISSQKKLSSLFQASLNVKYYSKVFWGLRTMFFLTLAVLIIVRIKFKLTIDKGVSSLMTKKDVIKFNEYRNFEFVETASQARFIWQIYSGAIDLSTYGAFLDKRYNISLSFLRNNIFDLDNYNQYVLQTASTLDEEELTSFVFSKDVRVYSTYFDESPESFMYFNTFQATDRLLQTALSLYSSLLEPVVSASAQTTAHLLFRNSLNDILLVGEELSSRVLDSWNEEYHSLQRLITLFLVVFVAIIVAMMIAFTIFLRKQYLQDVFYMSAVCQLNPQKLQAVFKELENFKVWIESEKPIDKSVPFRLTDKSKRSNEDTMAKKARIKTPEIKDLKKKYIKTFGEIFLVFAFFIFLVTGNSFLLKHPITRMEYHKNQLFFTNHARDRLSLGLCSYREVAATNNTAQIENELALTTLEEAIEELTVLRSEAYKLLTQKDILDDIPQLQTLLLGDGCQLLEGFITYFCEVLQEKGEGRGLVSLLNDFQGYLSDKYYDYQQGNKLTEVLQEIQVEDYDIILATYTVAKIEIHMLSDIIDGKFNQEVEKANKQRTINISVVLMVLGVSGMLGWVLFLRKLGESLNEIKNVLRLFPADVVFQSFILKRFLMETSSKALEPHKNRINNI